MSDRYALRPDSVPPPRSAHIALVAASSLCAQAPSREAHADVVSATPPDHVQQASKWMVLALSGTAAFMTTLDSDGLQLHKRELPLCILLHRGQTRVVVGDLL